MEYLNKSFTVGVGSTEYREGWERIFGKKEPTPEEPPKQEEEVSPKEKDE